MEQSNVYVLMSPEDTYDMTLINSIDLLLQKLRSRQDDKKRLYRIEQVNAALITLERLYQGRVPEEFSVKVDKFDDSINVALKELQTDVREFR